MIETNVLGPLDATIYGRPVTPTAAKPRQILALLALYTDRVLPASTLMDEIWGERPPRSAPTTLQTYILQLRRLIEEALPADAVLNPKDVLVTRHGGYMLHVAPGCGDVAAYEKLRAEGNSALERGADAEAAALYTRALGLWRGPTLVDVRHGPLLQIEVARLEESRLGVVERRTEAKLRLGHHHDLLTELAWFTARHPYHESLHAQYMIALYRAGRPSRALEVFASLRRQLASDLGIDPSPRLCHLHSAILTGDPALDLRKPDASVLDLFTTV